MHSEVEVWALSPGEVGTGPASGWSVEETPPSGQKCQGEERVLCGSVLFHCISQNRCSVDAVFPGGENWEGFAASLSTKSKAAGQLASPGVIGSGDRGDRPALRGRAWAQGRPKSGCCIRMIDLDIKSLPLSLSLTSIISARSPGSKKPAPQISSV